MFLVSCGSQYNRITQWNFKNSRLENYQGYLKSNDIINLGIKNTCTNKNRQEFLRSHNFQFTIGNDTYQEIVCHNERLGGNDEVYKLFIYYLFI